MSKTKVVVIGVGSASFGRGALVDLLSDRDLNEAGMDVVLVDTNQAALDRMLRFAGMLKDRFRSSAELSATSDRCEALPGADFVITSVAIARAGIWRDDQLGAFAFGFRHPYSENGGPGGAFHTLRSMHLMVPIAQDIDRLSPKALLLNFTNPESRICLAVHKLTGVKAVGLCHGAMQTLNKVAELIGMARDDIRMTIGGINHFHWVMGLQNASDGKDLLPKLHEVLDNGAKDGLPPLARHMYETFGLLPFPADSHIGEYVGYAFSLTGPILVSPHYACAPDARRAWLDDVVEGRRELTDKDVGPTEEFAIPIIRDTVYDRGTRFLSVNVPNTGCAVANIREDAIVEVPATVDASGVTAERVGPLPEGIAAMCNLQAAIQNLLVEAYRTNSKGPLLQALLLDPVVDDAGRAEKMMNTMLTRQSDYLPALD